MLDRIKFFMSEIWVFLQPLVKQLLTDSGKILARAAIKAVTVIGSTMGSASNEEKRQAAFEMILTDLKKNGIQLGTAVINAALEAAVVKLKAKE